MIISDRVGNSVGKEKLLVQAVFLFSQCFRKASFLNSSKGVIVWEWVNAIPHNGQGSGKQSRAIMALLCFCLEQVYFSTKSSVVVKSMDCAA